MGEPNWQVLGCTFDGGSRAEPACRRDRNPFFCNRMGAPSRAHLQPRKQRSPTLLSLSILGVSLSDLAHFTPEESR